MSRPAPPSLAGSDPDIGNGGFANTTLAIKLPYLRRSYQTKKPVGTILMEALPGTLMLALAAMFIAICLGIPLGVQRFDYIESAKRGRSGRLKNYRAQTILSRQSRSGIRHWREPDH